MDDSKTGQAIMRLSEQVGRIEGKLDSLVTHEGQGDKLLALRRELQTDIHAIEGRLMTRLSEARTDVEHTRDEHLKAQMSEVRALLQSEVKRQLQEADETQARNMKRAQVAMWSGGGVGIAGGLMAVLQLMGWGGQ